MNNPGLGIRLILKGRHVYIAPDQILWIYSESNYSQLQLANGSTYMTSYSIGTVAKQVGVDFIRIHRKYLCNRMHIEQIDLTRRVVQLRSGHSLPLSRRRLRIVREELTQHETKGDN